MKAAEGINAARRWGVEGNTGRKAREKDRKPSHRKPLASTHFSLDSGWILQIPKN